MSIHFNQASYLGSATTIAQLLPDHGAEIAFMGRSNAGKSSAINTITHIRKLARASTTPGRTQMINFFGMGEKYRLVDLPGYGFAKTSRHHKQQWEQLIADYLASRQSLVGLVLVMDSRHPLKSADVELIEWCTDFDISLHILLTKADKLTLNEQKKSLLMVQNAIAEIENISVQLFSALKKQGVDEAQKIIAEWLLGNDR